MVAAGKEHPLTPSDAPTLPADISGHYFPPHLITFPPSFRKVIPRGFLPGFVKSSLYLTFNYLFIQPSLCVARLKEWWQMHHVLVSVPLTLLALWLACSSVRAVLQPRSKDSWLYCYFCSIGISYRYCVLWSKSFCINMILTHINFKIPYKHPRSIPVPLPCPSLFHTGAYLY